MGRSIDKLIRGERLRNAKGWLVAICVFTGVALLAYALSGHGPSREVSGTALGFVSRATEGGHVMYLRVQLESGPTVFARAPSGLPVEVGSPVTVSETESLLGAGKRYRFLRYASP